MEISREIIVGRRTLLIALLLAISTQGLFTLIKTNYASITLFILVCVLCGFVFYGYRVAIWIIRILSIIPILQTVIISVVFLISPILLLFGIIDVGDSSIVTGVLTNPYFIGVILFALLPGLGAAALFYILWFSKPVKHYWNVKRKCRTSA